MSVSGLQTYAPLVLHLLIAAILAGLITPFGTGRLEAAQSRKLQAYECGMEPTGDAREPFSVKFYLVAMVFILFDVEAIFLYPWAMVFRTLGCYGFMEMMIYIAILLVGYFIFGKRARWTGTPSQAAQIGKIVAESGEQNAKCYSRKLRGWNAKAVSEVIEFHGGNDGCSAERTAARDRGILSDKLEFNYLSDATSLDRYPVEPRFELSYHLVSIPKREDSIANASQWQRSYRGFGGAGVAGGRVAGARDFRFDGHSV